MAKDTRGPAGGNRPTLPARDTVPQKRRIEPPSRTVREELALRSGVKEIAMRPGDVTHLLIAHPTALGLPDQAELEETRQFYNDVIRENASNLASSSKSMRDSVQSLKIMYTIMFVVGVATAVAAIVKGLWFTTSGNDVWSTLIMAGLSASSFFSLFLVRPLESLERNSIYAAWLIASVNTYWTLVGFFEDPGTFKRDMTYATSNLVKDLKQLADAHAAAIGKYAPLQDTNSSKASNSNGSSSGSSDTSGSTSDTGDAGGKGDQGGSSSDSNGGADDSTTDNQ